MILYTSKLKNVAVYAIRYFVAVYVVGYWVLKIIWNILTYAWYTENSKLS